jgi:hypothetical protein
VKPGDTVETAMWLDGTEPPELLARYRQDVLNAMLELARSQNLALTPIRWTEKRPGEDRMPEVPDHIQGPSVRLLVAEADVLACLENYDVGNFLAELEPRDLMRLHRVTRKAYAKQFPGRVRLTDRQCNTLINDLGPDAALASLETGRMLIQ